MDWLTLTKVMDYEDDFENVLYWIVSAYLSRL